MPGAAYGGFPGPAPRNGLGTAGLVLGIVGIVLAWVPIGGLILGILATVFGAVGLHRARKGGASNRGVAIAGLVLGIATIVISCLIWGIAVANS